jgi:hypothetical protein
MLYVMKLFEVFFMCFVNLRTSFKVNKLATHLMFIYHANDQLSNMPLITFDGNTPCETAYFACVPWFGFLLKQLMPY